MASADWGLSVASPNLGVERSAEGREVLKWCKHSTKGAGCHSAKHLP